MGRRLRLASRVLALAIALGCAAARADDAPRMYQPAKPEMVGYPNWVLVPDGKARIDATLERQTSELFQLRSENASLKASLVTMEQKPALTWTGGLFLVGAGLVLGLAVGIPIAVATR